MRENTQTQQLRIFYSVSTKNPQKNSLVFNFHFILFIFLKIRFVKRPDTNWQRSVRRKRKAFRGAHRYRECSRGAAAGFLGASTLANRVGKRRARRSYKNAVHSGRLTLSQTSLCSKRQKCRSPADRVRLHNSCRK